MKIAVIGAGISGLTAGRELANAGHEVVVFEKSGGYGGRLATRYAGKDNAQKLDHGVSFFTAESSEFKKLVTELAAKDIITTWEGSYATRNANGKVTFRENNSPYYYAPKGMNTVGKYLGRNLDIRLNEKVGGLTHIGENRRKKKSWMLNFPTALTESADAVIISAPARQAYALLNTTIDEIETLKLVREIDEVEYESQFTLMAGFEEADMPEWNALDCEDDVIEFISNETTKRNEGEVKTLVVHTTSEFAKKHMHGDREVVEELITDRLTEILGGWAALADWKQVHFWRYSRAVNPLPHDFMEIRGNDTPLALVGAYMNGNTVESAYLSGLKLGKHWVQQFAE
ncbi:MAG: FAD-dependent oxidoreductase [Gracilimonas sp.]|uniref:NAD(P)/FAD-dependent oxidoreductase n=1 Tax=Gracilimonas TaxID=649462 RepID=UPI001B027718|nr:FAD-dependent oxidoreductase [Gracilimonas sp.]MBO6586274.1 FAD-dependent oxidoreductase [Gracilimonas sp.]MBO6614931.1 FAD-dependent oxidoreductase [Gracilimonas sp.]